MKYALLVVWIISDGTAGPYYGEQLIKPVEVFTTREACEDRAWWLGRNDPIVREYADKLHNRDWSYNAASGSVLDAAGYVYSSCVSFTGDKPPTKVVQD